LAFAASFLAWTRGETGFVHVLSRLRALLDKRPYHEPAGAPGHD
jgi:hypothetical protein